MKYHVRQYFPSYFEGFDPRIIRDVEYEDILKAPWLNGFRHNDFDHFEISPYGEELIIMAYYKNGKHWVAAFAAKEDTKVANSWIYMPMKEDKAKEDKDIPLRIVSNDPMEKAGWLKVKRPGDSDGKKS